MPLGFAPLGSTPIGASAYVAPVPVAAPIVTGVTVSPATATGSQQFTATVAGSNSPSQAVTWAKTGGGTLSASGAFVEPTKTSSVQIITITATSVQDGNYAGSAIVTIAAAVIDPPDEPPVIAPVERFARPSIDLSNTGWQPSTGTDLFAMVDDMAMDNSDYISAAGAATCELALAPVIDPHTSNNQAVRYQAHAPDGGSLTVTLKQGSTVIASWHHAALPTVATVHEQRLTAEQCDSITNYHDLRVELAAA